ncbi:hypothetical protein [Marihabitans asiaticum]|nr:hypothetical protein [Marihabitans asiaticum]
MATGRVVLDGRRLGRGAVLTLTGWTSATLTRHRRTGRFPTADGYDPTAWWWHSTLAHWLDQQEHVCPECHRILVTAGGLRAHTTRMHNSGRKSAGRR